MHIGHAYTVRTFRLHIGDRQPNTLLAATQRLNTHYSEVGTSESKLNLQGGTDFGGDGVLCKQVGRLDSRRGGWVTDIH